MVIETRRAGASPSLRLSRIKLQTGLHESETLMLHIVRVLGMYFYFKPSPAIPLSNHNGKKLQCNTAPSGFLVHLHVLLFL